MKRFTDTAMHRQPWFRKLKPKLKCAVRFLFDECDATGMWTIDIETMSYFVGVKITVDELLLHVNSDKGNRIEMFGKDKIFIPGFVEFQYGHLSENSPAHKPIFSLLRKYSLLDRVLKGLLSRVSNTLQETETDKDKDKDFGKSENLLPEIDENIRGFVVYDAEKEILTNQIEFERICSTTGKKPKTAKASLRKYHLWLEEKEQYPKGKKAVFAGFEKWLMNEYNFKKSSENDSENGVNKPSKKEERGREFLDSID